MLAAQGNGRTGPAKYDVRVRWQSEPGQLAEAPMDDVESDRIGQQALTLELHGRAFRVGGGG